MNTVAIHSNFQAAARIIATLFTQRQRRIIVRLRAREEGAAPIICTGRLLISAKLEKTVDVTRVICYNSRC